MVSRISMAVHLGLNARELSRFLDMPSNLQCDVLEYLPHVRRHVQVLVVFRIVGPADENIEINSRSSSQAELQKNDINVNDDWMAMN